MSFVWDVKAESKRILEFPWEEPAFYAGYLSQVVHYTRYSTRMLAAAASLTMNQAYYKRLVAHIREEEGHDRLALADLKQMGEGYGLADDLGVTRALWETQFYKIQRHPEALLGYVLALEMFAVEVYPPLLVRIREAHGSSCVNFVRVHAEEDPHHVDEALEQICALGPELQDVIWRNFEQTKDVLLHMLGDIRDAAAERSKLHHEASRGTKRAA